MYKPLAPGGMADALRRHSQTLAEIVFQETLSGSKVHAVKVALFNLYALFPIKVDMGALGKREKPF